jgi:hypothetical protein
MGIVINAIFGLMMIAVVILWFNDDSCSYTLD